MTAKGHEKPGEAAEGDRAGVSAGATFTWCCPKCDAKHVDAHIGLTTCCACGAEWSALTAPMEEVDAHLRAMGVTDEEIESAARRLRDLVAAR